MNSHRNGKRADRTMKETRQRTNPIYVCERERKRAITYKYLQSLSHCCCRDGPNSKKPKGMSVGFTSYFLFFTPSPPHCKE